MLRKVLSFIYLVCLSACSSLVFGNQIETIDAEQLTKVDKQGWLILDVRSEEEYQQGHVPGAVNIAHHELAEKLAQVIEFKDQPVVVYCRSGRRAAVAEKILLANEFSQVKHLEGDMLGWQSAGFEIEK